jgi:hypothetical protein
MVRVNILKQVKTANRWRNNALLAAMHANGSSGQVAGRYIIEWREDGRKTAPGGGVSRRQKRSRPKSRNVSSLWKSSAAFEGISDPRKL